MCYNKVLNFCDELENEDQFIDSDEEIPEKALIVGSILNVYDYNRRKWYDCEIVDNIDNEIIMIKYKPGDHLIVDVKDKNTFGDLCPKQ